ncbi:unnamed protein product [Pedinophyceae sp. YPF-701]|nr:unnamed protein product [Pedinophyceae sp. YPF-701]
MEAEAAPMIEHFGLKEMEAGVLPGPLPSKCYRGDHAGMQVVVVTHGKDGPTGVDLVGTVPAALVSYLSVMTFKPDLVINAGTAGGFAKRGGAVGDVYVSTAVANHDRRISIPGFDVYGVQRIECAKTDAMRAALGFKAGVVSSGNSLEACDEDLRMLDANEACIKEMEASAHAWTCSLHNVPFVCVKAITDIVDGDKPSSEEFLENLGMAAKALQTAMPRVLEFVSGKRPSEL